MGMCPRVDGLAKSFAWVHVSSEDMLQAFPPHELVKGKQLYPVGANFALTSSTLPTGRSQRGRPSLPCQEFHIEVARMFRDDQLPTKKEAAIAQIQSWFLETHVPQHSYEAARFIASAHFSTAPAAGASSPSIVANPSSVTNLRIAVSLSPYESALNSASLVAASGLC